MTQLGHLSCVYTLTSQGEGAKLRGQGARARPFIPGARHTHWDEHTQAGEPLPAGLGRRWSLFQRPPAPPPSPDPAILFAWQSICRCLSGTHPLSLQGLLRPLLLQEDLPGRPYLPLHSQNPSWILKILMLFQEASVPPPSAEPKCALLETTGGSDAHSRESGKQRHNGNQTLCVSYKLSSVCAPNCWHRGAFP